MISDGANLLLISTGALIAGIFIMIKSADLVVEHASIISRKRGISEMTIGMTLVALATSLPELAVSSTAMFFGESDIALGNVVGSNITNIALVMGLCAIIKPLVVDRDAISFGGVWMLVSTGFFVLLVLLHGLDRISGILMLVLFAIFLFALRRSELTGSRGDVIPESVLTNLLISLGAGIVVWVGSWLTIEGVNGFASYFGVPKVYLALTVVAVGTSLPELVTSVVALTKDMRFISVGNLFGSNIFNLLMVLGVSSVIGAVSVSPSVLMFYLPVMVVSSVLGVVLMLPRWRLERWKGGILLGIYLVFIALILMGF